MRILFSFAGGNGHFLPLVPLAKLAAAERHNVMFTGRAGMLPVIEAAGFSAIASGMDFGDSKERFPLMAVNMENEYGGLRDFFAGRLAHSRARDVLAIISDWKPDMLVCDEVDFGAMLAAEKAALPYASVNVIAAGSFLRKELLSEPLNTLRAEMALLPDPELNMLSRYLVLSPVPPSYRDPDSPLPENSFSYRPFERKPAQTDEEFAWISKLEKPLVYFTLGTVFNRESGDLFTRVIEGLKNLPIQLVVTLGAHIEPEEFGAMPPNVHLRQYIPQDLLLPHCDLVVSHAGSGSLMGALAHALPSVLLPMGADQPLNAARCEALGIAKLLDVMTASPQSIAEAVTSLLAEPSYRQKAEILRDEIWELPSLEAAWKRLKALGK